MSRFTKLFAVVAATLSIQACSMTPSSPDAASTAPSRPDIEPLKASAVHEGTDLKIKLTGDAFTTQYVSGDIQELVIGLYDLNPGDAVDPDSPLRFAFSLGGLIKTNDGPALSMLGGANTLPYFASIRTLVNQAADTALTQNGRYMIRHFTKDAPGGFTSPITGLSVTFYNIPDGNYKVFAAAVKNGVFIGRDVQTFAFNASDRIYYHGSSGSSYVDVPALCLQLDPNPDIYSDVGIHDNHTTPSF